MFITGTIGTETRMDFHVWNYSFENYRYALCKDCRIPSTTFVEKNVICWICDLQCVIIVMLKLLCKFVLIGINCRIICIKFLVRAIYDVLFFPSNLHCWGLAETPASPFVVKEEVLRTYWAQDSPLMPKRIRGRPLSLAEWSSTEDRRIVYLQCNRCLSEI